MEKDRNTKIIAITAIIVGVIGISLGFAFTSSQLRISSRAEVNPIDDFYVYFSSSANSLATNPIAGVPSEQNVGIETTNATIDNNTTPKSPTISNLKATFTQPGQYATYTFYAWNDNDYTAYLRNIIFASTRPTCTARNEADQDSVDLACAGISLSISVDDITNLSESSTNITNHSIEGKNSEPIVVKIDYASNAKKASGAFDVVFGDITLEYDSVDGSE